MASLNHDEVMQLRQLPEIIRQLLQNQNQADRLYLLGREEETSATPNAAAVPGSSADTPGAKRPADPSDTAGPPSKAARPAKSSSQALMSTAATGVSGEVAEQRSNAMTLLVTGIDVEPKPYVLRRRNDHDGLAVLITEADDAIIDQFITQLKHPEQVTQLCIFECQKMTSQCLTPLLAACTCLEDVTLGCDLFDAITETSLAALHGCSRLKKVQLGANRKACVNIADTTVKALSRLVVECRRLEELKLYALEETSLRVLNSLLERQEEIQNADGTPRSVTFRVSIGSHTLFERKKMQLETETIKVKRMKED